MIASIQHRSTFEVLRSQGLRTRSGPVRMLFVPVEGDSPQVAFAFGRKFGNAVERNRARRRLRAAFIEAWCSPNQPGAPLESAEVIGAFQLSGTRSLLSAEFSSIVADCRRCLARLGESVVPGAATESVAGVGR